MAVKRLLADRWHVALFSLMLGILSVCSWGNFAGKAMERIPALSQAEAPAGSAVATQEPVEKEDRILTDASVGSPGGKDIYSIFSRMDRLIDKTETVWRDGIFLKSELSRIDSLVTYCTIGEIVSSQVLQGKDGWLFYRSVQDGSAISDYEGTDLYTENEMREILSVVRDTDEKLKERGIRFAILIAPNKENVYPQYMPEGIIHGEISRSEQIAAYLSERGIPIVFPIRELSGYSDREMTGYYRYDSHWNQLGAYIGVRSVLGLWDIEIPAPENREIRQRYLRDHYHYCGMDDLAQMVGLRSVFNDEMELEINGTVPMDWETFASEQGGGSHFINPEARIQQTLVLVGDSFRSSMVPALREVYRDVWVYHRSAYRSELLEEIMPDALIEEHVERYADGLRNIDYLVN